MRGNAFSTRLKQKRFSVWKYLVSYSPGLDSGLWKGFPSFAHWPARLTKIQNVCFRPVIEFTFGYAIQVTSEFHVKFHAKNRYRTNRIANFSIEPGFELWRCSAPPVKLSGLLGAGLYVALSGPVEGSHHSLWNNWNSRCFSVFSRFWNI